MNTSNVFYHNSHGELLVRAFTWTGRPEDEAAYLATIAPLTTARELVKKAALKDKIPAAFDSMDWERINSRIGSKKIGTALHHEIYDISPDGKTVLMCSRTVEGTKYGVKTLSKEYFIVRAHGRGTKVELANKALAAKAAKAAGPELGAAIDVVTGKSKLVMGSLATRHGYKLVTRDDDGNLVSVWDGSCWEIGKRRGEKATLDHSGGFYYYRTAEEARKAAAINDVFGSARDHAGLVLIEVEASGTEYLTSDSGKRCCTYLTPVAVVEE